MKKILFSTCLILCAVSVLYPSDSFAQDYAQWHLPEGARARLGKGLFSGKVQFSPDGARLAVVGFSRVWIYDTQTYQELALLTGHQERIASLAFSPDGQTLASGSWAGVGLLWSFLPANISPADVNSDGIVSIQDLVLVASHFGEDGQIAADVNRDGIVNIVDLVLVAAALDQMAEAPR